MTTHIKSFIAEMRKLCEGASSAPWLLHHRDDTERTYVMEGPRSVAELPDCLRMTTPRDANAAFIAAARTALPQALDYLEQREVELAQLRAMKEAAEAYQKKYQMNYPPCLDEILCGRGPL